MSTPSKRAAKSSITIDPRTADDYEVAVDPERGLLRVAFRNSTGTLSFQIFTSDEAYAFGQKIMRGYDKLEGL